jgi:hypothetical protein
MTTPESQEAPLLCARCARVLHPGRGELYLVRIEAVADPTPPVYTADDLAQEVRGELKRLIRRLSRLTERELEEQVHRRLVLHFCVPCYRHWIEDPANP